MKIGISDSVKENAPEENCVASVIGSDTYSGKISYCVPGTRSAAL